MKIRLWVPQCGANMFWMKVKSYVQGGSGSKIVDARETFGTLLEISK